MTKKVFITGATGFIGQKLAATLKNTGSEVVALVRDPQKAQYLAEKNIQLVKGDLFSTEAMTEGMAGCDEVYHLAAFASVWAKDDTFEKVNIQGTLNVLNAAQQQGVKKTLVTSTAGVIGPAIDGPVNEESPRTVDFFTPYESSKYISEQKIKERVQEGQHIVIVNPTRVYGPGPLNVSNSVTKLVKQYLEGKWKFIPGNGMSTGNYVYVEDVIQGHMKAMEKGRAGERYLLGGEDATYHELFDHIAEIGGQRHKLYNMPLGVMLAFGKLQLFMAEQFGRPPMITPGWVRKYHYEWKVSSEKANKELGYQHTSLRKGLQETINWLKNEK